MYASKEEAVRVLQLDACGQEVVSIVQAMCMNHEGSPDADVLHPVVILEGLDGTGKSTLVQNLPTAFGETVSVLKSPPEELLHLRPYFDKQPTHLRRAFYALGNYACALAIRRGVARGPVIVDRFWPSTVAYALACDSQVMPEDVPHLMHMPQDMLDMLPTVPLVALCLHLSEEERAQRVRARAGCGPAMTSEEVELERSRAHRERLMASYRALTIDGEPLTICEACGSPEEVLARAWAIIQEKVRVKNGQRRQ